MKQRIEHFRNLVSLSVVDGDIQEPERAALCRIACSNDIPADRLNVMLSHASEYIFLIPQNTNDREKQLNDMIQLAWADGQFAVSEKELIRTVGERLGFSVFEVDARITAFQR